MRSIYSHKMLMFLMLRPFQNPCQHLFTVQGQQSIETYFHPTVQISKAHTEETMQMVINVHLPNSKHTAYKYTHIHTHAIVYHISMTGCSIEFTLQCTFSFGKLGWLPTEQELIKKTVPFNSFLLNGQQEKCN